MHRNIIKKKRETKKIKYKQDNLIWKVCEKKKKFRGVVERVSKFFALSFSDQWKDFI